MSPWDAWEPVAAAVAVGCLIWSMASAGRRPAERSTSLSSEPGGAALDGAGKGFRSRRLRAAGLFLGPLDYACLLACGAVGAFLVAQLWAPRHLGLGIVAAALVPLGIDAAVGAWGRFRGRRFEARLGEGIDAMVSALAAGQSLVEAVESAAESCRRPVRDELLRLSRLWSLGMGTEVALRRLQERYDSEGTRLFTQTLIAKAEVGGELAPVLVRVRRILQDRLRLQRQLKSRLAGSRLSVLAVALLPYALIPAYTWQRPEWLDVLRTDPAARPWLAGAVLLQVVGILWMQRITRADG